MSKGMATETIAKMLIVIFVVGIVVYIIYKYVLHSPLDEQGCAAMMTAWCGNCEMAKPSGSTVYSGGPEMSSKLQECIKSKKLNVQLHTANCGGADTDCKSYLPVSS